MRTILRLIGLIGILTALFFSAACGSKGEKRESAPQARVLVSGTVVLPETLEVQPPRFGALFVSLVLEAGPPLAVKTYMNPKFPFSFQVTEADLLMKETEPRGPFWVRVRFDQDGNVETTEPGDWVGETETPVDLGATGVQVVIAPIP